MITVKLNSHKILITILLFASFLHFFRLDYPNAYVFDEVYHGFTAKEYLKGNKEAWEWWTTPPPGVAFEWTHPPLAKEIMTGSMFLVSTTDAWGWRLPGAILGIVSVFLVYKIGKRIFNENTGLISAFLFSIDGLNFVQSRTGMNDIYIVTFALSSIYLLLNKRFFLSAIFLGLAFASKWSALYLLGLNSLLLFYFFISNRLSFREIFRAFLYIAVSVPIIYLLSYLPFFYLGHTTDQFIELQRQMWWYHSNLKATHDYSSPAWSWPLNLYPVWYFVEYHKNGLVSNIFASGNPVLFWMGVGALLITIYDFLIPPLRKSNSGEQDIATDSEEGDFSQIKSREDNVITGQNAQGLILNVRDKYLIVLLGFFVFWLPWNFSPRIMFLYHYSPSIPFLCLSLGYQINLMFSVKNSRVVGFTILGLVLLGFFLVYPMLTGLPLNKEILVKFFDMNLTKNPFAGN